MRSNTHTTGGSVGIGTHSALGWLAGLLEGEGTFESNLQHALRYPRIALRMCDEDVVQRASALIGSRSVWREEPREDGWSATYGTALMGARAAELMSALLPYMGQRRASEISVALGAYAPIRLVVTRLTCTVPGCGEPHDARGLCHRHHMQWWRDVRAARAPRVTALDSSDPGRAPPCSPRPPHVATGIAGSR